MSDGLAIRTGDRWKQIRRPAGLRGSVYSTLQDREGSLWIALLGRGLVRLAGYEDWEAFTSDSGFDSDVIYQIARFPMTRFGLVRKAVCFAAGKQSSPVRSGR
jgi:hypothetical protein